MDGDVSSRVYIRPFMLHTLGRHPPPYRNACILYIWPHLISRQGFSIFKSKPFFADFSDAKRVSPCVMCTCTKEGPLCQSLKIENCFHLAQSFTPKAILNDHVCKVQCAFAFRAFPSVKTGENKIGFS